MNDSCNKQGRSNGENNQHFKKGGAMKERFKRLGLWSLMICLLVLVGGVTSQAVAQTSQMTVMPGMPFIANSAINAPILGEILTGQIPATIPQYLTMPDPTGRISTYQPFGQTITAGHGFFTSTGITNNGRTCFTCHQPQNDWEISPPQILTELITTWGKSALFQPIDTANRPNAPGVTAPFPDTEVLPDAQPVLQARHLPHRHQCPESAWATEP